MKITGEKNKNMVIVVSGNCGQPLPGGKSILMSFIYTHIQIVYVKVHSLDEDCF